MSFDPTIFRQSFEEFADPGIYSTGRLTRLANAALLQMDAGRWDTWLDMGTDYFVAHKLTLEDRARARADVGGDPGLINGPQTAKAVGEASATYDATSVVVENAGEFNLTVYGLEWIRLARMIGAGPLQVI